MKAAGFVALARVLLRPRFPALDRVWQPIIVGLAVASMVLGNLVALAQRSLKRMLAYSSVAHAGYLLAAVWSGSRPGSSRPCCSTSSPTAHLARGLRPLGALGRDGERDVTLDDLAGLAEPRPWMAFAFARLHAVAARFPGTFGFIGKW